MILCLYNADTLNICMKEFGSEKIIFDKMTAAELRQLFPFMAFVYAWIVPLCADQLLPQLLMEHLILCRYNVDTLNICMKELIIFVGTDSTETLAKFFH